MSDLLFEQHGRLFALLVSLERLTMAQLVTAQERELFVHGIDVKTIQGNMDMGKKPAWMTVNVSIFTSWVLGK